MKIIQTPVRFTPAVGGVEKYVQDLSVQLVRRGHDVTVVVANEPASELDEVSGIHVRRLRYIGKFANTNITPGLLRQLLALDFDVIHTHMPTPWSAELSLLTANIRRRPCVITYHNDVEKTGLIGLVTRAYNATVLRWLLNGVRAILVTQPGYIEQSAILKPYRAKIRVVPNGVAELPAPDDTPRADAALLFVSVLDAYHRYKGLDVLLQAIAQLKPAWPQLHLDVVGRGELVEEYRALAASLGIADRVTFCGFVSDEALDRLYRRSTVFILPSIDTHEGFGIVLLEAMARSTPVITTQIVALSADIDAFQAGAVVPEKDASALAHALDRLLRDPAKRAAMGAQGRELVHQKYLWSALSATVEQIYREVME